MKLFTPSAARRKTPVSVPVDEPPSRRSRNSTATEEETPSLRAGRLFIDTSSSEKIIIGLEDKKFETSSKKEKSQRLLPFIDEILKSEGKKISDITEIEVATGPGSYTGLRVGVSVAQTIGWFLKVPVNGIDVGKGKSIEIKYE